MRFTRAVQQFGRLTVNPVVLWLVRTGRGIPGVSRRSVLLLETVGRRTGKRRVTPMGYVPVDGSRVWVVSEHGERADWFRNATKAGTVTVQAGDRRRRARLAVLPDEDPKAVLKRMSPAVALANRALWDRPRVVEIRFEDD
ncbi:MAG TPA: nitroreductase family deazaflavin-dependent oxidoreductase [Actinomycetota bacterium]|nr:nitroreductase family deazaflavin-dependent oxidoreductase [Actinomycetota bacterium]